MSVEVTWTNLPGLAPVSSSTIPSSSTIHFWVGTSQITILDHFADFKKTDLGHPLATALRIVFFAFLIWGLIELWVKYSWRFIAGVHLAELALMLNWAHVWLILLTTAWMGMAVPLAGFSS